MSLEVEDLRRRLQEQIEMMKHFPNGPNYRSKKYFTYFRHLKYK
jgi:hypothetical protein